MADPSGYILSLHLIPLDRQVKDLEKPRRVTQFSGASPGLKR